MILACKSKKIGASVTFSMSAICARVSFRQKLTIARGTLARSNAEQVAKVRGIVEAMGREVVDADGARRLLALKGADRTAI